MVGDSYCYASKEIKEAILEGKIISDLDEDRIQPSSFEPTVGSEVFILDTSFGANKDSTIYRSLLELPKRRRQRVDINGGYELKKGFTYIIPLEERVKLDPGEFIKSSPKSSLGRVFLNTRLLGDYNHCFDEINSMCCADREIMLWLLVQPLAFNLVMHPGLSLNQLRLFKGVGAKLSPAELLEEIKEHPLLYTGDLEKGLEPAEAFLTDGLEVHLDLSGEHTDGIVGLRSRCNPMPIDLAKKSEYEAEDFFEPVMLDNGKKRIHIKRGEYYLFASSEILQIPAHLNVELMSHSHIGFHGPLHFAGFIDNGFKGDLVFEVRCDEVKGIELEDGKPVSKLDVFRTLMPGKLYGQDIGSNYQFQVGARPAKYFKPFDFTHAARNYDKLAKVVLVQDAKILKKHRWEDSGFEFIPSESVEGLFEDINNGFWHSRYDCESDGLVLQIIPYTILFNDDAEVFSYVRATDIKDYGDERLFGKHSIGLGGHTIKLDGPDFVEGCIEREVFKEEIALKKVVSIGGEPKEFEGEYTEPKLVGTLFAEDNPVDKVHFGLIYASKVDCEIVLTESSAKKGGERMIPIADLVKDRSAGERYETWSRILIPYLEKIYESL